MEANPSGRFRTRRSAGRTIHPFCSSCIATNRGTSWAYRLGTGPGVEPILTIEEMKSQAAVFYEGLMESWKLVTSGDLDVIAERKLVLRNDDGSVDVTVIDRDKLH
jgi:hypothetical protein